MAMDAMAALRLLARSIDVVRVMSFV